MSAVNTDELAQAVREAERRVLKIQTKLHRWACDDPRRRFDDLFNLVADAGFLLVAWDRVRGNKGARTAGVDGRTPRSVVAEQGVEDFLDELRAQAVFAYLSYYTWRTVWRWLRRKHRRSSRKELRSRYCGGAWWPASQDRELFDPEKVGTTRYRDRGSIMPSPWPTIEEDRQAA